MKKPKQKSSGWQKAEARRTWQETHERIYLAQRAKTRRECDTLGLWRSCRAARCRRARGCTGEPRQCMERRQSQTAQQGKADARVQATAGAATRQPALIGNQAAGPKLSAAEAAAAIAASLAEAPPQSLFGEELGLNVRDNRR